jgi:elongation factor G
MANFLSDARASLRVADAASVVVDAVSGVQVSTEKVWSMAAEMQTPRLVVLNRLDRERANLGRALDSLRGVFGRTVIPIQLPIGERKGFRGVVDLVAMKAWTFASTAAASRRKARSPANSKEQRKTGREALIEMVAEADDALMEKFFETGTLTQDELVVGLKRAVAASRVFPLVCTAGASNIGSQPLLDAILAYAPTPAERPLRQPRRRPRMSFQSRHRPGAGSSVRVEDDRRPICRPHHDVSCDQRRGQGGFDGAELDARRRRTLRPPQPAARQDADQSCRSACRRPRPPWPSSRTPSRATPRRQARPSGSPRSSFPSRCISTRSNRRARGDEEKISTALHRLQEEDPSISYNRDPQTNELLLAGRGSRTSRSRSPS